MLFGFTGSACYRSVELYVSATYGSLVLEDFRARGATSGREVWLVT